MKIVTHNGHFHADDILAVATLLIVYPGSEVIRTRDEEIIKTGDIVVDVGQIYDPKNKRFDHHQPPGAGKRSNGIPYASFGLVWKEFGEIVAGGVEEARIIEDMLASPVDAIDNGVNIGVPIFTNIREYNIGDYFESFAKDIENLEDFDKAFTTTVVLAGDLLKREINFAKNSVRDWKEVERLFNQSENKRIITLPRAMHWKRVLVTTEALFVVTSRPDGKWQARAVMKEIHGFEVKKPFPTSWAGLNDELLAGVSGVKDAVACHKDRWLVVAKSKEGAIKLAEIALNS